MCYCYPPLEILDGEIWRVGPIDGTRVELGEDENGYIGWLVGSGHCASKFCSARRRLIVVPRLSSSVNVRVCGHWLDG